MAFIPQGLGGGASAISGIRLSDKISTLALAPLARMKDQCEFSNATPVWSKN
jgi:hypothetical protein